MCVETDSPRALLWAPRECFCGKQKFERKKIPSFARAHHHKRERERERFASRPPRRRWLAVRLDALARFGAGLPFADGPEDVASRVGVPNRLDDERLEFDRLGCLLAPILVVVGAAFRVGFGVVDVGLDCGGEHEGQDLVAQHQATG